MHLKIGDFGLSVKLKKRQERRKSMLGTPNYIAPEVLDDLKHDGHSFQVDAWAVGVIVFALLFGTLPFES
jgi:serine/threonine protein kinase